MKKLLRFAAFGFALVAAATFTGCSNEDALVDNFDAADGKPLTRSASSQVVIDFEDLMSFEDVDVLAGPTSYGLNYRSDYNGTQITGIMDLDGIFMSMENEGSWPPGDPIAPSYMFGGIAVSDWAMTKNPSSNPNPDKPFNKDWWYSEYNQMSVYNTARTATGNRGGAGANGSNNFGVVYGFDDSYGYAKEASFDIQSMTLKSLKICNTAYTYGVIQNGNTWIGENGVEVTAKSLKDSKGYFNLIIKCFDASGNMVKRIETPLADYRNGKDFCVTTWTTITVNAANVAKVQFGFWGSDIHEGGPTTPCYVAIDDIVLE